MDPLSSAYPADQVIRMEQEARHTYTLNSIQERLGAITFEEQDLALGFP
jgi:hypothetical protein